ncbi:MAG: integrase [Phycisphaeraceae bacterium]|nr:MAG: integrase [Phycisphaeraceae bacterium]
MSSQPHGARVTNPLRRLLDDFEGFLASHTHLIHDRDPLFTGAMVDILQACGIESVKLPPRSPNLNAYAERFVRSIKSECLEHVIPIGEQHLRRAVDSYVEHYNRDRPHQGLGNNLLHPCAQLVPSEDRIVCDEKIGGLIRSYRRAA